MKKVHTPKAKVKLSKETEELLSRVRNRRDRDEDDEEETKRKKKKKAKSRHDEDEDEEDEEEDEEEEESDDEEEDLEVEEDEEDDEDEDDDEEWDEEEPSRNKKKTKKKKKEGSRAVADEFGCYGKGTQSINRALLHAKKRGMRLKDIEEVSKRGAVSTHLGWLQREGYAENVEGRWVLTKYLKKNRDN